MINTRFIIGAPNVRDPACTNVSTIWGGTISVVHIGEDEPTAGAILFEGQRELANVGVAGLGCEASEDVGNADDGTRHRERQHRDEFERAAAREPVTIE